jgi:hypothetical protein
MLYTFLHLAFVAVANLFDSGNQRSRLLEQRQYLLHRCTIAAPGGSLRYRFSTHFAAGVAVAAPLPRPTAGVTEVDLLPHPAAGVDDTRDPLPHLVAWVLATMPLPHLTVADDSLRSIGRCASRTPWPPRRSRWGTTPCLQPGSGQVHRRQRSRGRTALKCCASQPLCSTRGGRPLPCTRGERSRQGFGHWRRRSGSRFGRGGRVSEGGINYGFCYGTTITS